MGARIDVMVVSGVSAGDVFHFDLQQAEVVKIGREASADLMLQAHNVSRKHAAIELCPDGFYLRDEGSSGGTVHMGFQLRPGREGMRKLSPGDEFKIGDAIFRVDFSEQALAAAPVKKPAPQDQPQSGVYRPKRRFTPKQLRMIGLALLSLLLLLFLLPSSDEAPPDQSGIVMNLPKEKVLGYIKPGGKVGGDLSHRDQAKFRLPPTDLVVEYEFRSESPVRVTIDGGEIETLQPETSGWETREMLVRDVLSGQERMMVFDNLDYPPKKGIAPTGNWWGIKNIRSAVIERENTVDTQLSRVLGLMNGIDSSSKGLFFLLRAVQGAAIAECSELSQDAVAYSISMEAPAPTPPEIGDMIKAIIGERQLSKSNETLSRHLKMLAALASRLEAELWRRVNSRLTKAQLAADTNNPIEAYDNLHSAMEMFPGEEDYRWLIASRMMNDKKIVPDRVRTNPDKYRKH